MGMTEFLLVVAVGGGIVAVLFATFKGAAGEAEPEGQRDPRTAAGGGSAERAELEERERALVRSLEEIEADHEAGNLSRGDYEELRGRYEDELARLRGDLAAASRGPSARAAATAAAPAKGGSRATSAIGWTAGVVAFLALAWLVMSQALSPRQEGDTITGNLPGQEMGGGTPGGVSVAPVDAERLAELEHVVQAEPENLAALLELGHLYLSQQRFPELAEVTRQALQIDSESPEALTHLGMLLFSSNHPQGVLGAFDRALEIDPDFAEALQFKGMVSFMSRDYATAVEAWERYLAVVPPEDASPRIRAMLEAARASAGSSDAP